jgi:AAA-like domain
MWLVLRQPLMLAMGEVETVFDTAFRSDFFGMLRSWHNSRLPTSPAWIKLDLALVTSTEPYDQCSGKAPGEQVDVRRVRPRRHRLPAGRYRHIIRRRFQQWRSDTGGVNDDGSGATLQFTTLPIARSQLVNPLKKSLVRRCLGLDCARHRRMLVSIQRGAGARTPDRCSRMVPRVNVAESSRVRQFRVGLGCAF